mgnify:FL=1
MSKRWKEQERRVARLLGAKRNPNSGAATPDAENEWLVVENKDRLVVPSYILNAVRTARIKAGRRRLGIATLTSASTREVLVLLDLRDFRAWFGRQKETQDHAEPSAHA